MPPKTTFSPLGHYWKPSHISLSKTSKALPAPIIIIPIDPNLLARIPVEIWQLIFSHLPLLTLHQMSTICQQWRLWVDINPIWKQICEKSFPDFNLKNSDSHLIQSYRQLVLGHLYLLCDECLEFSPGMVPKIPLPVNHHLACFSSKTGTDSSVIGGGGALWMCRPCRQEYQSRFPTKSQFQIPDQTTVVYMKHLPRLRGGPNNPFPPGRPPKIWGDENFWNHEDCICGFCQTRQDRCPIWVRITNDKTRRKVLKETRLNKYLEKARRLLIRTKLEMVGLKPVVGGGGGLEGNEEVWMIKLERVEHEAEEEEKDDDSKNDDDDDDDDDRSEHVDEEEPEEQEEHDGNDNSIKKQKLKRYNDHDKTNIWIKEYIEGVPYNPTKIAASVLERIWFEKKTTFPRYWKTQKANRAKGQALSEWIYSFCEKWQQKLIDWKENDPEDQDSVIEDGAGKRLRICHEERMMKAFKTCFYNSAGGSVSLDSTKVPPSPPPSIWPDIERGLAVYIQFANRRENGEEMWETGPDELDHLWIRGRAVDCKFEQDELKDRMDM